MDLYSHFRSYKTIFIFILDRYFEALCKNEQLPVKDRLDYQLGQPLDNPVTRGALAVLHKQVSMQCFLLIKNNYYIYTIASLRFICVPPKCPGGQFLLITPL